MRVDEPLIDAEELNDSPGAPYSASAVRSAGEALRTETGWHIAPTVKHVVEVHTSRARVALLPTMHVVKVHSVIDADTGREVTGWRVRRSAGLLVSDQPFPEDLDVELEHGHAECPSELIPILAERAQRARAGLVRQENLGSRSMSLAQDYDPVSQSILDRYTLSMGA